MKRHVVSTRIVQRPHQAAQLEGALHDEVGEPRQAGALFRQNRQKIPVVARDGSVDAHRNGLPSLLECPHIGVFLMRESQAAVLAQIAGAFRYAVVFHVAGSPDHDTPELPDATRNEPRLCKSPHTQSEIVGLLQEIDFCVEEIDIDIELGKIMAEFRDDGAEVTHAERNGSAQSYAPDDSLDFDAHRSLGFFGRTHDVVTAPIELVAARRQAKFSSRTMHQGGAEGLLERAHPLADRGLGNAQLLGRARERAGIDHRHEGLEFVEIHPIVLSGEQSVRNPEIVRKRKVRKLTRAGQLQRGRAATSKEGHGKSPAGPRHERKSIMITIRPAQQRGRANFGWLDSQHTFSFGGYYDPAHMGFGHLRVINDDRVAPGAGFPAHPHRDMEIISYVVEGSLEHRDSMGNGSVITPGDVQRMSAGTGVSHSEYNPSADERVRFLQIWIVPERSGISPSYEQKFFGEERRNRLRLVASPDGAKGSVTVHQDVRLFASLLDEGKEVRHQTKVGRRSWLQVVSGQVQVGEEILQEGDGLAVTHETELSIVARADSNFLLFDLKGEAA